MTLIPRESDAHWYKPTEDGIVSVYELPKKNGEGTKSPTLRDARELGLWPSATNIISVLDKPNLDCWRAEQAILAALTLPQLPGESMDVFARRVVEDMDAQSMAARQFGSRLHEAIAVLLGFPQSAPLDGDLLPWLDSWILWAKQEIPPVSAFAFRNVEKIVGDWQRGYAGRLDLETALFSYGHAIIDFKSQRVKRNGTGQKPVFYPEWGLQLAAYGNCVRRNNDWPALLSVIIDSAEPGPVHVKVWDNPDMLFRLFLHCFDIWKWKKDYEPVALKPERN